MDTFKLLAMISLLVPAAVQCKSVISTARLFPMCTSSTADAPAVFKDAELTFELSNEARNATAPCSIIFRSPFQCPHPYSVQVFENDPRRCHHNLKECIQHQHIYWTKSGELELNLNVDLSSPADARTLLIIHVVRLKCDKSLREMLSMDASVTEKPTKRVTIELNARNWEYEKKLVKNIPTEVQPLTSNHNNKNNNHLHSNYLHFPGESSSFYIASPGFPRNPTGSPDCLYVIPRVNFPTCRLRIYFRFFNLPDPDERSCEQHYLLIDNRRICGCKSGLVYLVQLDNRPKVIRYVNRLHPAGFNPHTSFGFLLEVLREGCPERYQTPTVRQVEQRNSGFFGFGSIDRQHCQFSYQNWLQVISTPQWTARRPQCMRTGHPLIASTPVYH